MVRLNKEQRRAVTYGKGPLLIIAGAGTGKTTVITERIKNLILKGNLNPSEVLALTFTEKAAREMEERVDMAMPYGYTQMWILTFHSFCDRILRQEALHIGLDPKYKLMTQSEAIQFIRKNLFDFKLNYFRPLGNPTKFVAGMLQHFSRLQDEDINPAEYLRWARLKLVDEDKVEREKWLELAGAYRKYDELKTKEGVMDFGDLIVKTLLLFRKRPNILKTYQKQFRHILVDEFQDTNIAQNELVKLLVKKGNITVVADDDQSIYKWRGAAVSNVLMFRKYFPKTKIITLTKNYRSKQEILDKSYQLIKHNDPDRLEVLEKINKKLLAQRKGRGKIGFMHLDRVENEADAVALEIEKLIKSKKYNYRDFAVLVRANNHADPFLRAFGRHNLPCQFLGPGRLFGQPEIVDLIAYLKVLYNFEDSVSFYRLLAIDFFGINSRDLAKIGNYARRYNLSLFEAGEKVDDIFVPAKAKKQVKKITGIIKRHLKLAHKESAGQVLYYFLEETGFLERLLNPREAEAQKKAANIAKFFDKLKSYEVDHMDATIPAVVDWIELASELGESPLAADFDWSSNDAISILTVHSAKGLEFPVVFLVNLVALRFPSSERREQIPIPEALVKEILPQGDAHLEEERRLFYVGMTRAKDCLFLTAADYYGEGKREKKLSPFIFETLGETAASAEFKSPGQPAFSSYQSKSQSLTINNRPLHVDFLSYSQIEAFKICPLHYKLKYIFQVPTLPSASQSFGTSIHITLKDFFFLVKSGKKPSEKLLFKLLADNWVGEGFKSKSHEKKFFEKGKTYLAGFLRENFNPKNLPVLLEGSFTVPLGGNLKVGGKIDRVDRLSGGAVEIIDYKTGATIPTQREVDKNLQLSIYGLAATSIPSAPFGKKPEKVKLSLYFLDQQQKLSTVRTKAQLENARKEILEWKEKIEKSDFACSGNYLCQDCEYKLMCHAQ